MLTIEIAAPAVAGPLTVFGLLADRLPAVRYRSFAAASADGLAVTEVESLADVNALVVRNPLDVAVLLYEGEEVQGAQQNRVFDFTTLVGAGTSVTVPVSCVEHGRWDGGRHREAFTPAPQAASPQLRSLKRKGAGQQGVWDLVAAKALAHGVDSLTDALHDVFEGRREDLAGLAGAIARHDDQVGALVAIGGRFVVLDHVSEPAVWAALHGPLVQGYALDALECADGRFAQPSLEDARDFVRQLLDPPLAPTESVGVGEAQRFDFGGLSGRALRVDGELVALTAGG
jgi:hypothetical protein